MPDAPPSWLQHVPVALEVFAGDAIWSQSCKDNGFIVLPPIELEVKGFVRSGVDILCPLLQAKLKRWLHVVNVLHFGTPCTSMSRARKNDGGPPPLRDEQHVEGLPQLPSGDQEKVRMGNLFAQITLDLIQLLAPSQFWSVENPKFSFLWLQPRWMQLAARTGVFEVNFDMCAYGHASMKPTKLLTNCKFLQAMGRSCPGCKSHIQLTGKIKDPRTGLMTWRTKLAQVYPAKRCAPWAGLAMDALADSKGLLCFAASFRITVPAAEEAAVGQAIRIS